MVQQIYWFYSLEANIKIITLLVVSKMALFALVLALLLYLWIQTWLAAANSNPALAVVVVLNVVFGIVVAVAFSEPKCTGAIVVSGDDVIVAPRFQASLKILKFHNP